MPSTIDIRRRIRSTKNTQQITKAMKMVSAAKLRRAQDRIYAARPYAAALREVLASVAARVENISHPLLEEREAENNVTLIIVTGDRGLCGAFNTNAIRVALNAIGERNWKSVQLVSIGRKAIDFFKRRPYPVRKSEQLIRALSLDSARELAMELSDDFIKGKVDAVYVIFNEFRSIISQVVRMERLLPIQRSFDPDDAPGNDYLYEGGPEQILNEILPKHFEYQLYRALLESAAAEQGARMTAMEAATKNASDMISHLTLTYNRIRQAAITKEIIEIVSGAAAAE